MANPVNPVGASSSNPNSPTLGGSEVGANPPAVPASDSGAIEVFMTGITPLANALDGVLDPINPVVSKHHTTIGQKQLQVIIMAGAMLRTYPKLSGTTPDDLDAGTADVAACKALVQYLNALAARVSYAGRLRQGAVWHAASGAVAAARKLASENGSLRKVVADIDAVLATGPKADRAAHAALTAQAQAAKADARAAKAHAKAAAKTAAATALQHGTGGAVITQPAPSAPASSTTTPASGGTPGTPGSTTIR